MNQAIERRWISYDWFKLIVALILAALLLLFRPAASTETVGVTPGTNSPAVATAASSAQIIAPVLTSPAPGAQAAPGPITFSGKATPGVEVLVLVDGAPVGKARAGADGTWTLNATVDKPGARQVVVQALDDKGAVAASASPATLSIAAPAPQVAAPTLDLPGQPLAAGEIALSGTGTSGTKIEVVVDGTSAGTAIVGADRKWSLPVTLPQGDHQVVARALDAAGQVAAATSPVRVSVSGAAQAPTTASGSGAAAQAPAITGPTSGATVDAGSLTLSGIGTPGSQIEVLDGDKVIGTATIRADGAWSFPTTAAAGTHQYAVRPAGNAPAVSPPVSISVSAPPAPAGSQPPAITSPADGARLDSGPIAIAGTGAPGSQIEILDSDKVVGTVAVGADGTWSFQATPGGNTAAYSARPAGSATVAGKPIRVTIGAASAGACNGLAVNCDAWVTRTGGLVLRLRGGAGTGQPIIARLPVGTQVKLLEGPHAANGFNWWRVRTLGEREGWVAGEELRAQPD